VIADEKFSPRYRLVLGGMAVLLAAGGFAAGRAAFNPDERVLQPLQFNHRKHVKEAGLECAGCHQFYAERQHAGLPDIAVCQVCHETPITDSPEEKKLIALAGRSSPPAFRKLFMLPDHVSYSHRRHVTAAKLPCETCHGAIADTVAPPSRPLVRVTMATCVDCHARQNVQTDCTDCHR